MTPARFALLAGLLCAASIACAATQAGVVARVRFVDTQQKERHYSAKATPHTVVWLTPLDKQLTQPPAPRSYTMVQRNKMFTPHILVIPVGSTVSFPNRDPFFHNVFSFFNGRRFDLGLYQSGQSRSVVFNRAGVSYIFCNIHPEMSAVILALDTPYYGSANERGEIGISGVPPGTYTLQVWSEATSPEAMQMLTRKVTIQEGTNTDLGSISIAVAPNMLSQHLNKFGEAYEKHTPPAY